MLVFIAPFPELEPTKDGFLQRVAAIDTLFADRERTYLDIHWRRHFSRSTTRLGKVTVLKLNFFLHFFTLWAICGRADYIYVQCFKNVWRALPFYFFKKVITDMHGAATDELLMQGQRLKYQAYRVIERIGVSYSYRTIAVTRAMARHMGEKYGVGQERFLIIPIFEYLPDLSRGREGGGKPVVIYSGGAHAWQNVDLMLETAALLKERYRFVFLTTDLDCFARKIERLGLEGEVTLASVSKQEVYGYYRSADLGLLLRDDDVVNRVACPTKLIEYMLCGIIPVVLQGSVGDFEEYGYRYLTLDQLKAGELPDPAALEEMRQINYQVVDRLNRDTAKALDDLAALMAA